MTDERKDAEIQVPEDIAALSFEEAMAELDTVVSRLESGRVALEESIDLYTRGTMLRAHCEAKLKAAEARVEKITKGADGSASSTEPLDPQ